jgi:VWFA-related protein
MTRRLAGAAAVMLAFYAGQTFRSGAEAVHVDALVTDGNRPVGGLTAADFEVRDSGVLQRIDSVAFEDVPLSVMLALDTSESVAGAPLAHLKGAAGAVLELLGTQDRAALLTFSHKLVLRAPWTEPDGLTAGIALTDAGGATSLHDAAFTALTLKDDRTGRSLVLIFSDGDDTSSWLPGAAVIDLARRSDSVVYAVGLRSRGERLPGYLVDFSSGLQAPVPRLTPANIAERFLVALAEETGGRYVDAEDSRQLRDTFVHIIREFRSRYLLMYTPRGVDAAGWHPIEVKLKGKRGKVTARRGYLR